MIASFFKSLFRALPALVAAFGLAPPMAGPATAQEVSVSASAAPMTAGTEETITYTIRVEGTAFSAVETPAPPGTMGLALQRTTPARRRQVSLVNGKMQRIAVYEWQYRPVRDGTAQFRSVSVTVRGATFTTDPITVEVVPQSQRSGAPGASAHGSVRSPSGNQADPSPLDSDALFIRAEPETRTAYQNEQVIIEYHLYFRKGVRLRNSRLAEAWNATGFWREELEVEARPRPRSVQVNGTSYETIVLKRVAVFPTRTGALRIDPLTIETEARIQQGLHQPSPFFVPGRYESVQLTSNPLTIQVKPLPPGAPASFSGAVGTFEVASQLDADETTVGSAVELQATLSGTGNIATLEAPTWAPLAGVDTYAPDVETTVDRSGQRARGVKTFSYTLVPQSSGTHALPPLELVYFDPQAEQYRTLRSDAYRLRVAEGEARATVSTTGAGLPVDDVAGLMTHRPSWHAVDERPLYRTPWAYGAVVAPLLLALALLAVRRSTAANAPPDSRPDADAAAQLRRAERLLQAGDTEAFYTALQNVVLGVLSAQIGRKAGALARDQLDEHLARCDLPEHARQALFELLDVCDRACFSPAQPTREARQSALRRTRQLIDYLQAHFSPNSSPT